MFGVSIRLQAKFHIGKKNKIRWALEFTARLDHMPLISRQKWCTLGNQYSTVQNKKVILKTYGKS